MRNFKKLRIWETGFEIATNAFKIVEAFPNHAKWSIGMQISKSSVSIPSNIAEGCSRFSVKEQSRFIEIATGSTFELETQLLIAQSLKFQPEDLIKQTLLLVESEGKMLTNFNNKLLGK